MASIPFNEKALDDQYFSFSEHDHKYMYDDQQLTSMTTLVKSFSNAFDASKISKRVACREGKSQQDVIDEWNIKKEKACALGTNVHEFAEHVCWGMHARNSLEVIAKDTLDATEEERGYMHAVVKFFMDHPEIIQGYSLPEARIYNLADGIAGTVDLICNYHGLPTIADWKTSREIDIRGYEMMLEPVEHLHDCNLTHYQLQMSGYNRMLRQPRYGFHAERFIVIHLKQTGFYDVYDVPPLNDEIEEMVKAYREATDGY